MSARSGTGADRARDELDGIGVADEIELILPRRRVPIWVVRVGCAPRSQNSTEIAALGP